MSTVSHRYGAAMLKGRVWEDEGTGEWGMRKQGMRDEGGG